LSDASFFRASEEGDEEEEVEDSVWRADWRKRV
jgi:hypothetical protein